MILFEKIETKRIEMRILFGCNPGLKAAPAEPLLADVWFSIKKWPPV